MRISIIGTGYVGAVTGTCFADTLITRWQPQIVINEGIEKYVRINRMNRE